jgi:iron(III) transport system permease protein
VLSAALVATLTTIVVGAVCWFLARTDVAGRRFWAFVMPLSITVGPVVATMGWVALLSPNGVGLLNNWSEKLWGGDVLDIYSLAGIVLVLTVTFAPFAFLFLYGGFATLASDQEEAARVHGAGLGRVLMRISAPGAKYTLLGGWALTFSMSIQNLAVYALVGNHALIKTVPGEMYKLVYSSYDKIGEANILTLYIVVPSLLVLGLHAFYTNRIGTQSILSRRRPGAVGIKLGFWRLPALAFTGLVFVIFVLLPVGAVVLSSFLKYRTADLTRDLFTTQNYSEVRNTPLITESLWTTLWLALLSATLGTAVCFVLAYVSARRRGAIAQLAGSVPSILITIPGFSLGLGFLWASYTNPQLRGFAGGIWGLAIVLVVANCGYGTRVLSSAFTQFGTGYDEAAELAGKSVWTRIFRVIAPAMWQPLLSVWRLLAVLSILEVNVVLVLYSPQNVPFAVYTFQALHNGAGSTVYALGVIQMIFVVLVFALAALPMLLLRGRARSLR